MEKRSAVWGGAAFLVLILLAIFYISPLSEVEPRIQCRHFEGVVSTPQHEALPICGHLIGGNAAVYLPFRMKESEGTRFCMANAKEVEESCGITLDDVLLDDGGGLQLEPASNFYRCAYLELDDEKRHVMRLVALTKTPSEYSETGTSKISALFWNFDNSSFDEICSRIADSIENRSG